MLKRWDTTECTLQSSITWFQCLYTPSVLAAGFLTTCHRKQRSEFFRDKTGLKIRFHILLPRAH